MSSIFGKQFIISSWGESHGPSIGVVIEGCPPGLSLCPSDINKELERRRPGQSTLTSARNESDLVQIMSGLYQGKTLGSPIALQILNQDARPQEYAAIENYYRPSHADFTYEKKFGIRNPEGSGRASARETATRVAAGAVAKKILCAAQNVEIRAYVEQVHTICAPFDPDTFPSLESVEQTPVRCPDPVAAKKMIAAIEEARSQGDSVGGVIVCRIRNAPIGLGAPTFDRLEADLAKAMLSIPATKGFEIGSGFRGAQLKGSEHNDAFIMQAGDIRTVSNNSGGVLGGISNGEEIILRVAFKPTATILKKQQTVDVQGNATQISIKGRHDPCVLPRAVPIVEAMAALVLVDHWMLHCAQNHSFNFNQ